MHFQRNELQSGYRLSLVKVIQPNRHMNRKDAPGSPSCPSHTRAATCSPLVTYPPPSRPESRAHGTPVDIPRIPRPSACRTIWHGMEHVVLNTVHTHAPPSRPEGRAHGTSVGMLRISRPPGCRATWHGIAHVVPRQSHTRLRRGLRTGLMARPSACQESHVTAMPYMARHRCTCRRQTIPRHQLKPN